VNPLTSDCVLWTGVVNWKGYGVVRWGKTSTTAHRAAWITAYGPLADNLTLDHLCRNRLCVNLDHLEPVTTGENTRRAPWTQVTECRHGHPLSGDNLHIQVSGSRVRRSCKICRREAQRRYETGRRS
jgi:hypothetical protein